LKKGISFIAAKNNGTNATPNENPTSVPVMILRKRYVLWRKENCSLTPEILNSTSRMSGEKNKKTLGNEKNENDDNFFQKIIPKKNEKYIAEQRAHTANGISNTCSDRSLI
jgi:hypothetical protein